MCRGRELNPHARKQGILSPSCLPIPPPRHGDFCTRMAQKVLYTFFYFLEYYIIEV